ncbi:uncharacterized protein (DUF1810 family) [Actinoplanes tereljensis]|uniref:Calpastatin n=1 Tax=Paractinoplanes tereljensis TaxID=571912 RepID=A0A919NQV1_9ACTN|nr:DUF1810 domain-containing protein [Actinoplanes tereljensis]GIF22364.1 hypothetical protein Ate02nite_50940 [Actinoplanes tereljensis]
MVDFDLERFVVAQERMYADALAEIRAGSKETHWMWFVFPQVAGLGRSAIAQRYAISGRAEARAYLAHPVLGPRLLECATAMLEHEKSATEILGWPDDLKLCSSMTLFAEVAPDRTVFDRVIARFCGNPDRRTLDLLDQDQN